MVNHDDPGASQETPRFHLNGHLNGAATPRSNLSKKAQPFKSKTMANTVPGGGGHPSYPIADPTGLYIPQPNLYYQNCATPQATAWELPQPPFQLNRLPKFIQNSPTEAQSRLELLMSRTCVLNDSMLKKSLDAHANQIPVGIPLQKFIDSRYIACDVDTLRTAAKASRLLKVTDDGVFVYPAELTLTVFVRELSHTKAMLAELLAAYPVRPRAVKKISDKLPPDEARSREPSGQLANGEAVKNSSFYVIYNKEELVQDAASRGGKSSGSVTLPVCEFINEQVGKVCASQRYPSQNRFVTYETAEAASEIQKRLDPENIAIDDYTPVADILRHIREAAIKSHSTPPPPTTTNQNHSSVIINNDPTTAAAAQSDTPPQQTTHKQQATDTSSAALVANDTSTLINEQVLAATGLDKEAILALLASTTQLPPEILQILQPTAADGNVSASQDSSFQVQPAAYPNQVLVPATQCSSNIAAQQSSSVSVKSAGSVQQTSNVSRTTSAEQQPRHPSSLSSNAPSFNPGPSVPINTIPPSEAHPQSSPASRTPTMTGPPLLPNPWNSQESQHEAPSFDPVIGQLNNPGFEQTPFSGGLFYDTSGRLVVSGMNIALTGPPMPSTSVATPTSQTPQLYGNPHLQQTSSRASETTPHLHHGMAFNPAVPFPVVPQHAMAHNLGGFPVDQNYSFPTYMPPGITNPANPYNYSSPGMPVFPLYMPAAHYPRDNALPVRHPDHQRQAGSHRKSSNASQTDRHRFDAAARTANQQRSRSSSQISHGSDGPVQPRPTSFNASRAPLPPTRETPEYGAGWGNRMRQPRWDDTNRLHFDVNKPRRMYGQADRKPLEIRPAEPAPVESSSFPEAAEFPSLGAASTPTKPGAPAPTPEGTPKFAEMVRLGSAQALEEGCPKLVTPVAAIKVDETAPVSAAAIATSSPKSSNPVAIPPVKPVAPFTAESSSEDTPSGETLLGSSSVAVEQVSSESSQVKIAGGSGKEKKKPIEAKVVGLPSQARNRSKQISSHTNSDTTSLDNNHSLVSRDSGVDDVIHKTESKLNPDALHESPAGAASASNSSTSKTATSEPHASRSKPATVQNTSNNSPQKQKVQGAKQIASAQVTATSSSSPSSPAKQQQQQQSKPHTKPITPNKPKHSNDSKPKEAKPLKSAASFSAKTKTKPVDEEFQPVMNKKDRRKMMKGKQVGHAGDGKESVGNTVKASRSLTELKVDVESAKLTESEIAELSESAQSLLSPASSNTGSNSSAPSTAKSTTNRPRLAPSSSPKGGNSWKSQSNLLANKLKK